jgi:hypothetical protein
MNPVVRTLGKMLQLVGISSPRDPTPKPKTKDDPPSWRDAQPKKPDDSKIA